MCRLKFGAALGVLSAFLALAFLTTPAWCSYAPGELIVRYKPGISSTAALDVLPGQKATVLGRIDKHGVQRLKLPPGISVEQATEAYRRDPSVAYAGPNHTFHLTTSVFPDDPLFVYGLLDYFNQWSLYAPEWNRHDIHAPEAWGITTGSSAVIIAVLDTGVHATHEDLYVPGPNPKVMTGYNAIDENTDTDDHHGHGTFVAGVAAALTNNGIGGAGIAWNARILPVKVINDDGEGSEFDAAQGAIWAVDNGAKILNMSFGDYAEAPVMEDALDYVWSHGGISVCGSGNDNLNTPFYPAAYASALAVGATNEQDQRCSPSDWLIGGSNYGPWLDVMAPGNNIVSCTVNGWLDDNYDLGAGTSYSSPHVAGIAALVWSLHPEWTNTRVVQQIEASCDDIEDPGWDIETGYGRVNAYKALTVTIAAPSSIGQLKTLPNGAWASLSGMVVTCPPGLLTDRIYIENENKTSGILVYGPASPPSMSEGSRVDVMGVLGAYQGERALLSASFSNVQGGTALHPLGMPGILVGGTQLGLYQQGVEYGNGMNNLGLLIRCVGKVKSKTFTQFYIDDGSKLDDGSGSLGLWVNWSGVKNFSVGDYVTVTGISGCEIPQGTAQRIRTLRVRSIDDIVKVH